MNDLYPVTIFKARYGGVYEDAPWIALNCHADEFPADAVGSDTDCSWFFSGRGRIIGRGNTPDEALASLEKMFWQ